MINELLDGRVLSEQATQRAVGRAQVRLRSGLIPVIDATLLARLDDVEADIGAEAEVDRDKR